MTPAALRIGVTIGLRAPDESLWTSGIKQNALYLAKLLASSPRGHDVRLLNTTDVPITRQLPWDLGHLPTYPFDDGADDLDIVIELGGQISEAQTEGIKRGGARLVSYCCGAEYVQMMEAMIFRRHLTGPSIFINPRYDEVWIIPQVAASSFHYLQTFRRCPAKVVPFIWDPMALDDAAAALPNRGEYRPSGTAKRLTVIEPNIDVLKFCLYPTLIAEQAFRRHPDLIEFLHVANADSLVHDDREFAGMMRHLDIVNAHKASFIGRVDTPVFLHDATDVVISHQWGLGLSYFQLECAWQGYPLVHNASLIPDLGYFYADHDVPAGADALVEALTTHDVRWEDYRDEQRARIGRFLSSDQALIAKYDALLDALIDSASSKTEASRTGTSG